MSRDPYEWASYYDTPPTGLDVVRSLESDDVPDMERELASTPGPDSPTPDSPTPDYSPEALERYARERERPADRHGSTLRVVRGDKRGPQDGVPHGAGDPSPRDDRSPPSPDDIPPPGDEDAPPGRGKRGSRFVGADGVVGVATDYVSRFAMHPDGPTLHRWRGDWYRWTPETGRYAQVSDERIEASLYQDLGLTRPAEVRDVRAALIAVPDVLIDELELGGWIGEQALRFSPLEMAACPNGILHLPSRTLYPSTPRYFVTTSLGVAYDHAAPDPALWLAFLRQIWPHKDHASEIRDAIAAGDDLAAARLRGEERRSDESIAALQEWFGYMLTPDTRQQKIMLGVGAKRSGKGTMARVLSALLGGDKSVAAPTMASLGTNFGLWPLIGKTAAIIGDARLGGRSDIAQVVERLLSISGEDAQTIDRKHREPWTGRLSTRITIISNELPRFTDASDALAARMLILEFKRSFYGEEDTELTGKLTGELPGILCWAIKGWERLRQRGHFVQPATSTVLVDELADLASPVAAWVRQRCRRGTGPEYEVNCEIAFRDYQDWATEQGHQHKVTLTTFGRDLKAAAQIERVQKRIGAKRSHVYQGIRLREPNEVDDAR